MIEDAEDDAHEDDESARLGSDGEEGGDRVRRAFVDVGRPTVERTMAILKPMPVRTMSRPKPRPGFIVW